jgi:NADPH-dependent 2,4-dienoyl-CoA reductase/sulfur reductase-like enzyme/nitrite reductase/ring-hydroxylating ferredoxin subunit
MASGETQLTGPDLAQGIALADVPDGGSLLGHAGGEPVLVARSGDEVFAVGATCTHYGGPLSAGLVVGDTVRCPWHHACFSLRTGEAVRAPALNPIACYAVTRDDERIQIGAKREPAKAARADGGPKSVVIIGAGAAGHAAAEMLRRQGYVGKVTLVSADDAPPYDRPNLSKDYLAGTAPEEWIPLRPREFYDEQGIELELGAEVARLDPAGRQIHLADGRRRDYDALLLATGATPIRLPIPGADLPHVHTLRTLADSKALIARTPHTVRAVVIGASFIGLEVAASLRARNIDVHVVAPEARPLERVLGPDLGDFVRGLHEQKGVVFHLGRKPASIDAKQVTLDDGTTVAADLVVMGVGVRPATALAEAAGLEVQNGVVVDEYLQTSAEGIWAAGDIARWPDPHTGQRIRVEHWVVAQRQGQTAARNILGQGVRFDAVPFFWSAHYDVTINYVGHADPASADLDVDGSMDGRDLMVSYRTGERVDAVATVFRDRESLSAEVDLEGHVP